MIAALLPSGYRRYKYTCECQHLPYLEFVKNVLDLYQLYPISTIPQTGTFISQSVPSIIPSSRTFPIQSKVLYAFWAAPLMIRAGYLEELTTMISEYGLKSISVSVYAVNTAFPSFSAHTRLYALSGFAARSFPLIRVSRCLRQKER